jgi:hypothetical protein
VLLLVEKSWMQARQQAQLAEPAQRGMVTWNWLVGLAAILTNAAAGIQLHIITG